MLLPGVPPKPSIGLEQRVALSEYVVWVFPFYLALCWFCCDRDTPALLAAADALGSIRDKVTTVLDMQQLLRRSLAYWDELKQKLGVEKWLSGQCTV